MEVQKKKRRYKQKPSKFRSGDTVTCHRIGAMNLTVYGVGFDTEDLDYFYVCRSGISKYYLEQGELVLLKKGSRKKRTSRKRGR